MHRQAGFTLIEMVVAFAIFAMVAGGLYETFTIARKRNDQARQREVALLTAQSLLSEQRTKPFPWSALQEGKTPEGMEWNVLTKSYDASSQNGRLMNVMEVNVEVHPSNHASRVLMLRSLELVSAGAVQ